jgi:hypothetical protein
MTIAQIAKTDSQPISLAQQQILLDLQGFVLESTDTIFTASRHRPATEWSLFFASLLDVLAQLPAHTSEIYLPKIHSVTNTTNGLFDCSFMRVQYCDRATVIVWNIFDQTHTLEKIRALQQRFNEMQL